MKKEQCKKCSGRLENSTALLNTLSMGVPDFPGCTIGSRGQTISRSGPPVIVPVKKCTQCGHSFTT